MFSEFFFCQIVVNQEQTNKKLAEVTQKVTNGRPHVLLVDDYILVRLCWQLDQNCVTV